MFIQSVIDIKSIVVFLFNSSLRRGLRFCEFSENLTNAISSLELFLDKYVSESILIAVPSISIAIIFPVAIFLAERDALFAFDKNVIFRRIFCYKMLVPMLLTDIVALLFNFKILSVVCSILIIAETGVISYRAYKWICSYEKMQIKMTYRQKMRIQYLGSLKDNGEILETWNLIFSDKELINKNQFGLVELFIRTFDMVSQSKNTWHKSILLRSLCQNLDKINFNNIKVYQQLVVFSGNYYCLEQQRRERNYCEFPPYELKEIFLKLLHMALENSDCFAAMHFTFFEQVNMLSNSKDVNREDFTQNFLNDFFHELERSDVDVFDIWHGDYLNSITVTRKKLEDKRTRNFTLAIFKTYDAFMRSRIYGNENSDSRKVYVLEKLTEYILKDTDPRFWFDMMTFCYWPFGECSGKTFYYSMIKSWCENERNFGLCGRLKTFVNDGTISMRDNKQSRNELNRKIQESDEKEFTETAYLVGVFNRWLWNPEECKKILKEIKTIRDERIFDSDTTKRHRLDRLEWCFNRMLKLIDDEKRESKS